MPRTLRFVFRINTEQVLFRISILLLSALLVCCSDQVVDSRGTTQTLKLYSEVLKKDVEYTIYFPPGLEELETAPDPLFLLHGHGGDHRDWFQEEEGNVALLLDSLISVKAIPPVIAVSVNAANSWYVDSKEQVHSFYINEFIDHIELTHETKRGPDTRIITGNSAGGYGTLHYTLRHPDKFRAAIMLSPAAYDPLPPDISSSRKTETFARDGIFNDSIWKSYSYKNYLNSFVVAEKKPMIYLSVGDDDNYNIVPVVTELQQLFLKNEIPNELRIADGGHDWIHWRKMFALFLSDVYKRSAN